MQNFLYKLKYRFALFMQGRYGNDELSRAMSIFSLILFLLSSVLRFYPLYLAALVLLILSYVRIFSKNIYARTAELNTYRKVKYKLTRALSSRRKMWQDRKTHHYFKCTKCHTLLRVPKGVGKIEITCKVCKSKIIKKV